MLFFQSANRHKTPFFAVRGRVVKTGEADTKYWSGGGPGWGYFNIGATGRGQAGGASVGTSILLLPGEGRTGPAVASCPGELDSRVAQESGAEVAACSLAGCVPSLEDEERRKGGWRLTQHWASQAGQGGHPFPFLSPESCRSHGGGG